MSYYGRRRGGGSRTNGIRTPKDRHDVARAIAGVMARQRRGLEAPEYGKRGGRVDRRNLARVATGNDRVFSTRSGHSATRLRVVVVLDLSGSMHGRNVNRAVQTAWDFILASRQVPSMSLEVWGHTTGYMYGDDDKPLEGIAELNAEREAAMNPEQVEQQKKDYRYQMSGVREGHYVSAYQLYEPGMNARQFYRQLRDIRLGGNEDGWSLDAILTDVQARAGSNERVLAIMVSDGAPVYAEHKAGLGHVRSVVNKWRKRGVGVISVSVSGSLRQEAQNNMYGHQWVVPFDYSFASTDARRPYWAYDEEEGISTGTVIQMGRLIGRALV